jgi:hypothetical protein
MFGISPRNMIENAVGGDADCIYSLVALGSNPQSERKKPGQEKKDEEEKETKEMIDVSFP